MKFSLGTPIHVMAKKTQLYSYHKDHAKITEFGGFDMPLWYSGIVDEHNAVRNSAGLFDVSHMGRFKIEGKEATSFLNHLLPNDISRIRNNRAFYSTICNESGGIIDDTVTNKTSEESYTMVVNASNREKDWNWLGNHSASFTVDLKDISDDTALLAFQGPLARILLQKISDIDLNLIHRFAFASCKVEGLDCVVSRTGYTGEDGFEIIVLESSVEEPFRAEKIWNKLLDLGSEKGVLPCGLGARDSLRLEAGMCLYGNDLDDKSTPIEAALEGIVNSEKLENYPGRAVIEEQLRRGVIRRRIAFSMIDSGIPRHGYEIRLAGDRVGSVTSGTFSPTLKRGIGMGYVPPLISSLGQTFSIQVRNSDLMASVVSTPFYDTTRYGYKRVS